MLLQDPLVPGDGPVYLCGLAEGQGAGEPRRGGAGVKGEAREAGLGCGGRLGWGGRLGLAGCRGNIQAESTGACVDNRIAGIPSLACRVRCCPPVVQVPAGSLPRTMEVILRNDQVGPRSPHVVWRQPAACWAAPPACPGWWACAGRVLRVPSSLPRVHACPATSCPGSCAACRWRLCGPATRRCSRACWWWCPTWRRSREAASLPQDRTCCCPGCAYCIVHESMARPRRPRQSWRACVWRPWPAAAAHPVHAPPAPAAPPASGCRPSWPRATRRG